MESMTRGPVSSRLACALRLLGQAVLLVMVLLVEDLYLWWAPKTLGGLGTSSIRARCEEVKPGMSRKQAIEIVHHRLVPWYEDEFGHLPTGAPQFGMEFYGNKGACSVWLDEKGQTVTNVKFQKPGPITVIE